MGLRKNSSFVMQEKLGLCMAPPPTLRPGERLAIAFTVVMTVMCTIRANEGSPYCRAGGWPKSSMDK